jgi:transcriptional regulator of arginine metabolism
MLMTEKARRQAAILDLVRERSVSTQAELVAALREAGHEVVQTTVSRDVHELGLVKVRSAEGGLAYVPPGSPDPGRLRRLGPALRRWALSAESSGNLVVVQTPRGYAAPLADAIDDASYPAILGTVAGENTIIVVAAEGVSGEALRDELRGHLLEGAA